MPMHQPNCTPVPHVILRQWLPLLTDPELRILLIVCDQTLGWQLDKKTNRRKEEDWISHRQLKTKTGIKSPRTVSNALKTLIDSYKIVEARDSRGKQLETSKKRSRLGGRIYYRLALKKPPVEKLGISC